MATRIVNKVSWILTSSEWTTAVPEDGELCMDSDTGAFFIGDGTTTGQNLPRVGIALPSAYQDGDVPFVSGNVFERDSACGIFVESDPGTVVAWRVGQAYYKNSVITNQSSVTPDWDNFGLVISTNIDCAINLPEDPPIASSSYTWVKSVTVLNTAATAKTITFNAGYTKHNTSLDGSLANGALLCGQIVSTYISSAWYHQLL